LAIATALVANFGLKDKEDAQWAPPNFGGQMPVIAPRITDNGSLQVLAAKGGWEQTVIAILLV
jgi:hypothetical protein